MRTARDVDLCHALQECIHRFNHRLDWFRRMQRETTGCKFLALMATGQQAVMPDTLEPLRQHVLQEARDERLGTQLLHPFLAHVGVVAHPEGDCPVVQADQPFIGNGDPVRVARQIIEHMGRAAERLFRVHHQSCRRSATSSLRQPSSLTLRGLFICA